MKLISYIAKDENSTPAEAMADKRLGLWVRGKVFDVSENATKQGFTIPSTMKDFLWDSEKYLVDLHQLHAKIEKNLQSMMSVVNPVLTAPVPYPTSCRDGYAFRQHVETMRKNRGMEMAPEFDQFPIFYYTNHNAIVGSGDITCEQDHFKQLDFELEVAIVIGKRGMNISANKADDFIIGYTIMNDFSARLLQNEEMKLSLGPAKGKDFATAIGPYLVTKDELEKKKISTPDGDKYDLTMMANHNGNWISNGNLKDMNWTFAQIIERASYGVELLPGDVIGSGTCGTGCYAEINSTKTRIAKETGDVYEPVWLKPNDTIELEVEGLGTLTNKMKKRVPDYSILSKKKNV